MPARSLAADQEKDWRIGILGPFAHDIGADGFERRCLMKIDDALGPRFTAGPARMIEADPDRDAPLTISDVGKMKCKHLARTQSAIEHETDHREIALATQLRDQRINLFVRHWAWHAMDLPEPHLAACRRP